MCVGSRLGVSLASIRHYDGTNYWPILAQSKRNKIYAVEWTFRKHRITITKSEALRVERVWKDWHRRCGWLVQKNVATHPETNELRAVAVRIYDAHSKRRLA
jgi:hypothetical protein